MRMQTTGSSPTTLKVKAWPTGTPEPSVWTVERTDHPRPRHDRRHRNPGLPQLERHQYPHHNTPRQPHRHPCWFRPAAGERGPTASFTATATDLTVALDASASTDPDGDVVGYTWDFGDGTPVVDTATATTEHTYAAGGDYQITLAVTDDDDAVSTDATVTVTVTAPATGEQLAADTFTRNVTDGLGQADIGGTWTVTGGRLTHQSVTDRPRSVRRTRSLPRGLPARRLQRLH